MSESGRRRGSRRRARRFRAYAYALGLASTLFAAWRLHLAQELLRQELLPVTVFSLLIGFAWYFSFSIIPRAGLSISLDVAYLMAALCVLPRPLPLAAALFGAALGCLLRAREVRSRHSPFLEVLALNTGGLVLTTLAGQWVSILLAPHWEFGTFTWWTVGCVVSLYLAYNLVNLCVMGAAVALRGEALLPHLAHYLRYIPSLELFTIPLGVGLALLYTASGIWGFVPLAATIVLGSGLLKRLNTARAELSDTNEQLQNRSRELSILNTIGREISASLDPEVVFGRVSAHLQRIFDAPHLFLSVYHPGPHESYAEYVARDGFLQPRPERDLGKGFTSWMVEARRPVLVDDLSIDRESLSCAPLILDLAVRSILAAPLTFNRKAIGVLCVQSPRPRAYTLEQLAVFTIIAQQAAVAIENARNYQLATVDQLTRLYLRDYFFRKLSEEQVRARRYGSTFALLMMDLDAFKEINDRMGHLAGDRFLRRVGEVIRETMRAADVPCRYGGEEFCILLPETGLRGARAIAERIRRRVARLQVPVGDLRMHTTISAGIACYPADYPGSVPGLLERADQALYAAKEAGRNRVVAASSAAPEPVRRRR